MRKRTLCFASLTLFTIICPTVAKAAASQALETQAGKILDAAGVKGGGRGHILN